ncbi:response regulator [Marinomonas agarivorans]|nr:response regulator [Marinomonas agarivorans]
MTIAPIKLKLSFRAKVFLVIFIPGMLLSILFSALFFYERSKDFESYNQQQLKQASTQFSALYQGSHTAEQLEDQLHAVIRTPNIVSAHIYNQNKQQLATVGSLTKKPIENLVFGKHVQISQSEFVTFSITPLYHHNNSNYVTTPSAWLMLEFDNAKTNLKKYELSGIIILLLIIFNIGYVLFSLYLANLFSTPIEQFNHALDKAKDGQYDDIKNLTVSSEYFPMLMSIIAIVERLENNHEEMQKSIEQATKDMRRNMDNMEEKSAQLHIANREKSESNRLKTQFLANISHEVRTPLNAILGYTQLLQKDQLDKQQRLYINTIEQSTNNLLAIIGDILDFSKIEAGKLSLENTDVNIRDIVDDVYQILSANLLTNKKKIDLVPEIDKDVPEWVSGDATRIRQILTNLIGNAIKFTHKGFVRTKITLLKQSKTKVTLSIEVIDSGIGIPDNKLPSLFKAFSQVNTSTTREFGGTGLGLVITKKLVEQMSGSINVSSEHGVGSTFQFTLKLEPSSRINDKKDKIHKHLLIFEPSSTYRHYLDNLLQDLGTTATFCSSLEHFIHRLTVEDKIDAVLLSVDGNDDELAQFNEAALYAVHNFQLACILMTQLPNKIDQNLELQNLATDVLLKPISHRGLYQSLKELDQKTTVKHHADIIDAAERFANLNILAVDDNQINLQLVTHWLQPYGINVSLAYSGQQALNLAAKEDYDLIIMDIQMPEMDGMETTRRLRKQPKTKDIPIIALTAHALKSEQKLILECGMNAYLTKPVNESKLLKSIKKWCFEQKPIHLPIFNKDIEGIVDIEKSLDIVDQQVAIAKDMFSMLINSLESEKQLIEHHFKESAVDKLIQVVHRLHGASKYCGTPELTKQAGFVEQHLKELGLEGAEEVVNDLLHAIDSLLDVNHLVVWPND